MKIIGIILFFCILNAFAFVVDNDKRSKRSPQDGFFSKVKTGFTSIVSDVKRYTNKGVEEVKNLFSSDRKVGDYRIDQLDVRFGGDEDENGTLTVTESFNQINSIEELKRDKRDANEGDVDMPMDEFIKNLEDQLGGESLTTEGTNIKSTTLENNAEVSPGYPAAFSIIHVPLKCPDGKKIVGYRCRTIYEN